MKGHDFPIAAHEAKISLPLDIFRCTFLPNIISTASPRIIRAGKAHTAMRTPLFASGGPRIRGRCAPDVLLIAPYMCAPFSAPRPFPDTTDRYPCSVHARTHVSASQEKMTAQGGGWSEDELGAHFLAVSNNFCLARLWPPDWALLRSIQLAASGNLRGPNKPR